MVTSGLNPETIDKYRQVTIILNIKWQDMVPDTEVLTRAGIPSIHTQLQKAQVRWAGHVTRMPDDGLPKQLLYGELCYGDRPLWHSMIHTGARTAKTNRIAKAQKERAARKARLYSTTSTSAGLTYQCPDCGRVLQA